MKVRVQSVHLRSLQISCLVFLSCSASVNLASGQTADERLETFFKANLEESFQLRPFDATILGDHRFDHLLDDVSVSARDGWLRQQRMAHPNKSATQQRK
jgi:hypothetical protein